MCNYGSSHIKPFTPQEEEISKSRKRMKKMAHKPPPPPPSSYYICICWFLSIAILHLVARRLHPWCRGESASSFFYSSSHSGMCKIIIKRKIRLSDRGWLWFSKQMETNCTFLICCHYSIDCDCMLRIMQRGQTFLFMKTGHRINHVKLKLLTLLLKSWILY